MSIVPNVSSIFRDISHISTTSGLIIKAETPINYSLEPKIIEEKTCLEGLHSYKQQKHNELLARLRNSTEEHERIIGVFSIQNEFCSGDNGKYKGNTASRGESFLNSEINSLNNTYQSTNSKFAIPKIRYRHIEDVVTKGNDPEANQISAPKQSQNLDVLKEFYEDFDKNQNVKDENEKNFGNSGRNNFSQEANLGANKAKFNNRISKGSLKYEAKLESYYDMCKKNAPQKGEETWKQEEKFMRPSSTKSKAMNLDEAIKMLSLS